MPEETSLHIEIARRYYHGDESKTEIAGALGLSRFRVARLLDEARDRGIVRIEIGAPGRVDPELSAALARATGVAEAIVVEAPADGPQRPLAVGRALADAVRAGVADGMTLGTTWSRAAVEMARDLRGMARCRVVQLGGSVSPPEGLPGSVELTRMVAAAGGGEAMTLYSPLVLPDAETAAGLRRQSEVALTIACWDAIDIAVLAVGAWTTGASAVHDLLDAGERARLTDAGVCGEISGRLFDGEGAPAGDGFDARIVGIDAAQLRAIPRLITSSHGVRRAAATRAAIAAGLVGTLVVDDELARALIDPDHAAGPVPQ